MASFNQVGVRSAVVVGLLVQNWQRGHKSSGNFWEAQTTNVSDASEGRSPNATEMARPPLLPMIAMT